MMVGKINANFHNNIMPKEGSHCVYLSVILIDSVFKMVKSYYPQVFLEKFQLSKFIDKELEIPADKSDEEAFDEEQIKTKCYDGAILMKQF